MQMCYLQFRLMDEGVNQQTELRILQLICRAGVGVSVTDYIGACHCGDLMAPWSLSRVSIDIVAALFAWGLTLLTTCIQMNAALNYVRTMHDCGRSTPIHDSPSDTFLTLHDHNQRNF